MLHAIIAVALQAIAAQAAGSPAHEGVDDEIVVTAPQEDVIGQVVSTLSVPAGQGQLARWHRRLCVGVVGLPAEEGQYVVDRIGAIAAQVDVTASAAGCEPDAVIYYTSDPNRVAEQIAARRDWSSAGGFSGTRGRSALRAFAASSEPVRWWHVSEGVATDGQRPSDGGASGVSMQMTGAGVVGATILEEMPSQRVFYHGRLRRDTRRDFTRAFVVVDARAMDGVSVGALSDYLAMVVLAQLNPEPIPGLEAQPSILNLFSENPNARAMTDWDSAYLHGLYRGPANALVQDAQEREITRRIVSGE